MSKSAEVTGKVIEVHDPQSGGSTKAWTKQSFVIETSGQYPKKIAFNAWNDKCDIIPKAGTEVTVLYNPESREYNGKWYTDLNVFDIVVAGRKEKATVKAEPVKTGLNLQTEEEEDLPF
jgi:hypothetical protein